MSNISVKITIDDASLMPVYSTVGAAGADLKASESGEIPPHEHRLIKTGVRLEIPEGYEVQIRPRSGLALKNGVTLLNSPGTIDCDYRGEIGVIMINHSDAVFKYNKGDRIAQMVAAKYEKCDFVLSSGIDSTARGEGGFGHTGF